MQTDFHFYALYILAKAAGFPNDIAYDLAYASQFTDDNDDQDEIVFEGGGKFLATRTQHVGLNCFDKNVQYGVYIPFHFIPGCNDETKLITQPNSPLAKTLVEAAIDEVKKGASGSIQRFGIALHMYADTWSHQQFAGANSEVNKISGLDVPEISDTVGYLDYIKNELFSCIGSILPEIGHAQIGNLCDEPFRKGWKYLNFEGKIIEPDNTKRALEASKEIFNALMEVPQSIRSEAPTVWEALVWPLTDCFSKGGNLDVRLAYWKDAFAGSAFPRVDVKKLEYDDWLWFNEALEYWKFESDPLSLSDKSKAEHYKPKPGFSTSKWRKFQDAAREHKKLVLTKLLPQNGIQIPS